MALRTVGVRLAAEVSGYTNNLRTAARSTRDFTGELDKAAKGGKLDAVANSAATMGLGLAAAFAGVVAVSAKFDKQMSEVGAVSSATAGEMDKLRQAALDAGKATSFSATEAAQAEAELAKAGLSTADILSGALAGSLDLAAAGSLDLAEAADISAKAMNIFALSGKDVGHIADVLAAAANKSATDVHELGEGLKMGGLAAHAAGMGLEETVGTLAAFADNALNGSDAGTSLKTALMMLQAPAEKSAKLMQELGIKAYDANGQFVGTAKLAGNLQSALGGLTQEQRNAALATIFGADGMRAANVLYGLGEQGVRDYIAAVDDQGAASETARKKTDNLAGDIDRLTGSLETMAIEAGSGANGGLRSLVQMADGAVGAFSSLPGPVQSTLTVLAGLGGAGLLAAAGIIKVKGTVGDTLQALRDMGPAGERAATGLGKVGAIAGKATLWGIAIFAAYEGLQAFGNWVDKKHAPVKANIDELTTSIKQFADSGKVAGELASKYGENLQKIGSDVDGVTKGMADLAQVQADVAAGLSDASVGENWNPIDPQQVQRIKDLDTALTGLVNNGGATQAKLFLDQLAGSGKLTSAQLAILLGMLPQYEAATGGATAANTGLAKGFGSAEANARTMAGSLQEAIDKGQKLIDVWNQLNGATLSFDQAQLKVKDAIDAVAASLKENGKVVEGNSRAAVENRVKVGEMAQAAADAAQKKYEETGSVTDATKVYDDYIGALVKVLDAAGLTDGQIATLIATYASMPSSVTTAVAAPGARTAKQQADDLKTALANIPPSKQVSVWVNTSSAKAAVNALKLKIAELQNKNIYVSGTVHWTSTGDMKVPGGTQLKGFQRWGGAYEHARDGLIKLRDAAVYAPNGPARYGFAEPATGGEAFIPKNGDRARSMSILEKAANWYGASVMPQQPMYVTAGGGGGSQRMEITVRWPDGSVAARVVHDGFRDGGGQAMTGLKYGIRRAGGNPKALDR